MLISGFCGRGDLLIVIQNATISDTAGTPLSHPLVRTRARARALSLTLHTPDACILCADSFILQYF